MTNQEKDFLLELFERVNITIKTYDKGLIPLERISDTDEKTDKQKDNTLVYRYRDSKDTAYATLRLEMKPEGILGYVEAGVINESLFAKQTYLSPDHAVILNFGMVEHQGFMANYRHKDWWTRPFFGPDLCDLPERTQSLIWKTIEEDYIYLLPVCDETCRTDLVGHENGLQAVVSPLILGYETVSTLAFSIATGKDPYQLADQGTKTALHELQLKHRSEKEYPEMMKYLGWCSWDAFYHQVHAEGLLQKAQEFNEKKLPVHWFIIDDGWLDVKDMKLRSLQPDKEKFPEGLRAVTEKLKQMYGISQVGVWHTIAGYWGGMDKTGEVAEQFAGQLFETSSGKLIPYPDEERGFGFWDTWHRYLREQGIDFVKVDSQNSITTMTMYDLNAGEAASGGHRALEKSVEAHFDGTIINCMGMGSENIWHRPNSSVSRNSDDFVPEVAGSFKEHALQNVYNSFYHGQFYWGDWDMYWTEHEDALRGAVLRAVSGGPVYFSDPVGKTDTTYIWPLIYKNGLIIKPDLPAMPTEDCLLRDPMHESVPLKAWNRLGDNAVIAAFHVCLQDDEVAGTLSPSDVPGYEEGSYIVYEPLQKRVYTMEAKEVQPIQLKKDEASLYNIIPQQSKCTPIGLMDKYLSAGTVLRTDSVNEKTNVYLQEGGIFGFVANAKPDKVLVNGEETPITEHDGWYEVNCEFAEGQPIIEIVHS